MEAEAGGADAGKRLDVFLAAHLGSRTRAQEAIAAGRVTVNDRDAPKRTRLEPGDMVRWTDVGPPGPPEAGAAPAGAPPVVVLWEDGQLMVVEKPAGVATHPSRGHASGTLAQALEPQLAGGPDPERAGIVHRLDIGTSGLLVVAKNDQAHRLLQEAISRREVRREYLALVAGRPRSRSGTIDAPIGRDRRRRTVQSTDTDRPREAVTHFEIEEELPHATLLRVTLETGRTHQIRAHLAAIGLPVAGDPEYGEPGAFGLDRQFLHATRLAFANPFGGEIDVDSPLPADLDAALRRARAGERPEAAPGG